MKKEFIKIRMKKKPINRHAKGMRAETKVKKILEERGYEVFRPTWNRFAKQKDIFGADLLGFDAKNGYLTFVQVKSNKKDISKAILNMQLKMGYIKDIFQEIYLNDKIVWSRNIKSV